MALWHSNLLSSTFVYSPTDALVNCLKNNFKIYIKWAGHVARMGEGRDVCRVLVGKPEGRRPLGRSRHRREDNIRMNLWEVGCGCVAWMELAQDRDRWRALVSVVMNLRVP